MNEDDADRPSRVCVVGSSARFLSGITIYTFRLANALSASNRTSAVLMRQLLPSRLYPGHKRVGGRLDRIRFVAGVRAFDGIDWHWGPSMVRGLWFLYRERPEVMIFQWWTGTVLHSYLLLAAAARLLGARIVVEFHEIQDTGELKFPLAGRYVKLLAPALMRLADGFAVHAEAELPQLRRQYSLRGRPVAVLPHGPHDHYKSVADGHALREAPEDVCNVLCFGLIREYKGLEDLLTLFNALPPRLASEYWLTIVGETWEGYDVPARLIEASPYRDRISFVNRYVRDDEVAGFFNGADVAVFPYRRSHISGALHAAMGFGLPVVVTSVGGLAESVEAYAGAIVVPPGDRTALAEALGRASSMCGTRYPHPHSWDDTRAAYDAFLRSLLLAQRAGARSPGYEARREPGLP